MLKNTGYETEKFSIKIIDTLFFFWVNCHRVALSTTQRHFLWYLANLDSSRVRFKKFAVSVIFSLSSSCYSAFYDACQSCVKQHITNDLELMILCNLCICGKKKSCAFLLPYCYLKCPTNFLSFYVNSVLKSPKNIKNDTLFILWSNLFFQNNFSNIISFFLQWILIKYET